MSGMNQRLLQCLAHAMGGDIVWIDSDLLVAPGMPKACPVASAGSAYGFARQRFGLKRDCYERIVWACRSVRFSAQLRLALALPAPPAAAELGSGDGSSQRQTYLRQTQFEQLVRQLRQLCAQPVVIGSMEQAHG